MGFAPTAADRGQTWIGWTCAACPTRRLEVGALGLRIGGGIGEVARNVGEVSLEASTSVQYTVDPGTNHTLYEAEIGATGSMQPTVAGQPLPFEAETGARWRPEGPLARGSSLRGGTCRCAPG